MVRYPVVVNTNEQLPRPELSVPLQVSPDEAFTNTLPVVAGVPAGTADPKTLKLITTGLPCSDGLGVWEVMVVLLLARLTVILVVAVAIV